MTMWDWRNSSSGFSISVWRNPKSPGLGAQRSAKPWMVMTGPGDFGAQGVSLSGL